MYKYYANCIGWPEREVEQLIQACEDSIQITRKTFLKHVSLEELRLIEVILGYNIHPSRGMTMASDWHVTYHRSKLNGVRIYYFEASAVEYVFRQVQR